MSTGDMSKNKQYTRKQVKENTDINQVLLILHDKVYNVHPFLNEHPGGEEILLDHKNKDASEDFDDVGHSKDAMTLMNKYQVGELVDSEKMNKMPKQGWVAGYNSKVAEKYVQPGVPFYLFASGVALVVALYFYGF